MNWNVRVLGLVLLAFCTWALAVPVALADLSEPPNSLISIDSPIDVPLHQMPTTMPLEEVDPTPEAQTVNAIAEPGSIGLVALMALMGGGAMMMRRRLG